MKKIVSILCGALISASTFAQVYVYNAQGVVAELDEYPDSIITIPPYRTPLPATNKGALNGVFSVSKNRKVRFSQGNLQYRITDHIWQFAEHQYDTLGGNIENAVIDQFGYGTSGWSGSGAVSYQPTETNTNETNYYAYMADKRLTSSTGYMANRDFGVHNPIVNGGNQAGLWRLLTPQEWRYVISNRWTPYAVAIVNGVWGVVILPDGWNEEPTLKLRPMYYDKNWRQKTSLTEGQISEILSKYNNDTLSLGAREELGIMATSMIPGYGHIMTEDGYQQTEQLPIEEFNITPSEWLTYEAKGCVFLPFNKSRNHPDNTSRTYGSGAQAFDYFCVYHSTNENNGTYMEFKYNGLETYPYNFTFRSASLYAPLYVGGCVRLVQDFE